ncbi:hypothetical protein [Aquimarina celericrescens]|uniref:Uncharacterized protein n=1 Tax=Aquimarina celericrescens TaxID=1964542 RepID=A0ABW5AZR8_9FLAO|nr:hypothetical protein [Aquimarina celericrescens]
MSETTIAEQEIKKRNNSRIYLIVASIIFGILIFPSLPMVMMSAMMFDSPGSQDSLPTIILVISMVAYPVVTCISIIAAWILFVKKKNYLAIILVSLPILNILIGIAAIIYITVFCDGSFAC